MANGSVGVRLRSAATYKSAYLTEASTDAVALLPPSDYHNTHMKSSSRGCSLRNPKRSLANGRRNFKWLCREGLALPVRYLIGKAKELSNWYLNRTSTTTTTTAGPSDDQAGFDGDMSVEPYFSIPVVPPP